MDSTDDMQKIFFNAEGWEVWPCKYCKHKRKEYITSGGTRNIEEHLWNKHKITEDAPVEKRLQDQQSSIEESMASAASHPQKRRRLAPETEDEKMLDPGVLESLYIKWITADNQALWLVECPKFRTFLTYLNSNVNAWLPSSHNTVQGWVLRQFEIEKGRVKLRIKNARSKIHIVLDL
jgi:hypothetical protein